MSRHLFMEMYKYVNANNVILYQWDSSSLYTFYVFLLNSRLKNMGYIFMSINDFVWHNLLEHFSVCLSTYRLL